MKIVPGLMAGLVLLVAAPGALAAPTVSVRIEGQGATLLERTTVTLSGAGVPGSERECPGDSAAAAIEAGTRGNWDRSSFTSTILGETHSFEAQDYWAEWIDAGAGYKRGNGICTDRLQEGHEVLMLVDQPPYGEGSTTEVPLDLEGVPSTVPSGSEVTVTVVGYVTRTPFGDPGDGERRPVAGATVSGGGAQATTGPDGRATLRLDQAGATTLKAAKLGNVPSAGEIVAVGSAAEPGVATPPSARDSAAPTARIALRNGATYSRRRAPRLLRGSVSPDPSGIRVVKLRLTKRASGRCSYFSGRRERFRGMRCGRGSFFGIGDDASWSYQLPARLPRGSYALEAKAVDGAFNRGAATRVRFRVK